MPSFCQKRQQSEPYARKSISQFDIIKDQQQSKNVLQTRSLNLQITITTPSQIHQITKILKTKSPNHQVFWG